MEPETAAPEWPLHVAACCKALRDGALPAGRDALRASLWLALHGALMRYLRGRSHGGFARAEDLEDIASAKAIDLLARAESGLWAPQGRTSGEIASYIATVARNGLTDLARRARRAGHQVSLGDGFDDDGEPRETMPQSPDAPPHAEAEARELARALVECVERLQPKARRVWFMRAFYDMTSREIAGHPEVKLDAAYVDVVTMRARDAIRACLERKGHEATDPPPGAFVQLWSVLDAMADGNGEPEGGQVL